MITPDAAWDIVVTRVRPLGVTTVSLTQALGHRLAEVIRADRNLPPADRSAMDGYEVRHADVRQRPCVLRIVGEVAAGSAHRPRIRPGTCSRIFTGANVPPGADTVVMVEQTEQRDGFVAIRSSVACGANILRRGEDARQGSILLRCGTRIDSRRMVPSCLAVAARSSADLVSAGQADGVMLLPPDQTLFGAGQLVAFRPWRALP